MFSKKKKIFNIIRNGTSEELLAHLKKHPDSVNCSSSFIRSFSQPATWAAYFNKPEALQILIDHGANINAHNTANLSALYYCARDNYPECTQVLLDSNVDIDGGARLACHGDIRPLLEKAETNRNLPKNLGQFVKENKHIVSITELASSCNITETTLYNFNKQTISIQRNDCPQPLVTSFQQAVSPTELRAAAKFLAENSGDLCGYKPLLIK